MSPTRHRIYSSRALVALLFLLASAVGMADEGRRPQTPPTLLIENVRLIESDSEADDPVVNILIRDGKLDIVTKDKVLPAEAAIRIDANQGFLLGKLEVGERPSFLILDEDPRTNFDALLDTSTRSLPFVRAPLSVIDWSPPPNRHPRVRRSRGAPGLLIRHRH